MVVLVLDVPVVPVITVPVVSVVVMVPVMAVSVMVPDMAESVVMVVDSMVEDIVSVAAVSVMMVSSFLHPKAKTATTRIVTSVTAKDFFIFFFS